MSSTIAARPGVLTPRQLLDYTRFLAAEVASGQYPFIDYDAEQRWHQRIYRDHRVDVWLISWLPTQGTQLHDHGGSAGAFTVVSGALDEASLMPATGELRDRRRVAGGGAAFDAQYIHDVRNLGDVPAVSVHAYSRPLTSMNYYDLADGQLQHLYRLETDDPEPGGS
jgi:hypothetical protein